ncbi:hypothetical protein RJ640_019157 [Escallonia rubra]|uniref:NAC domain-containing protein n=1 Tax=Escallonia rubra TaxID=112253 RepID=A0AA88R4F2_9ASTE|nr:hypothetical protein RJ640_019157 [Escallonia rubra]
MNLSVNGQSQVPPGFRFHPTEEELLHYYLRKKVASEKIDLDVIRDVDLNKLEPWDIQEKCRIGSTPQNDWYFFSHKDKKYPTGTRTNRATAAGFWKATGRDKVIYSSFRRIGMRKTLVFYKGRAPHGQKSDWIMHEYRLDDNTISPDCNASNLIGDSTSEEGWVVCRVFKKKNYHKVLESPQSSSIAMDSRNLMQNSSSKHGGVLDQILTYMGGRSCKQERETVSNSDIQYADDTISDEVYARFVHLPRLETSAMPSFTEMFTEAEPSCTNPSMDDDHIKDGLNDWATLDRLVASQLNGQVESSKPLTCYSDHPNQDHFCFPLEDDVQSPHKHSARPNQASQIYGNEIDLWSFARPSPSSSSDPFCHLSV